MPTAKTSQTATTTTATVPSLTTPAIAAIKTNSTIDDSDEQTLARLTKLQQSIDKLVDLIPAKHYFLASSGGYHSEFDGSVSFLKNSSLGGAFIGGKLASHNSKKQAAPKQAIKESSKKAKKILKIESAASNTTNDDDNEKHQSGDDLNQIVPAKSDTIGGAAQSIAELRDRVKEKIALARMKRGMEVEVSLVDLEKLSKKNGSAATAAATVNAAGKLTIPRSRQEILEKRLKKKKERKEILLKKKKGEHVPGGGITEKGGAGSKDVAAELRNEALGL
ncbi:hypothetical protein HK100_000365, partial [Physocladia obscura]